MGIITLGSSTISNIFATSINPTTVSSSVVGLLSSSYSNGSTWTSTTGSAVLVVNSPLISGSNGRWQFNGTDDYLNITQSTLDATFNQSVNAVQPFTFLFYGTIGSLTTRRALFGNGGGYTTGGDGILRTDTTPPSGTIHLDLRGPASQFNRFTITGASGSLLNLAIAVSSSGVQSVYQNGVLVATSGSLGAFGYAPWRSSNGTDGAYIGYNVDVDADNYNGQLGACYLYNRELTATEISQSSLSFFKSTNLVTASLVYLGSTLVYTSSAAPAPPSSMSVQTLVVAGGGSGGCGTGGGGGAGGVVYSGSLSLPLGIYAVNVGTGGRAVGNNGGSAPSGSRGQDSSLLSGSVIVSASGGGGGKGYTYASVAASNNGGSGGGGSVNASNNDSFGSGISGQGNNGGAGNAAGANSAAGGGGGGASQVGQDAQGGYPNGSGGNGGSGSAYTLRAGSSVIYGSGGGAGGYAISTRGGLASNGATAGSNTSTNPTSASINTGAGGGGSWRSADGTNNGISGNGGSGIIVVAYLTSSLGSLIVSGGIETTYTSASLTYKSHTFLSSSNLVIS
jgi:hypothetical protein